MVEPLPGEAGGLRFALRPGADEYTTLPGLWFGRRETVPWTVVMQKLFKTRDYSKYDDARSNSTRARRWTQISSSRQHTVRIQTL